MSSEQRRGQSVPYGSIADAAREAVTREGCAHLKTIYPGRGAVVFDRRSLAAAALRRSPNIVEVFPSVFAREDVAVIIRAVIDASRAP